jgi:hypothetical protein
MTTTAPITPPTMPPIGVDEEGGKLVGADIDVEIDYLVSRGISRKWTMPFARLCVAKAVLIEGVAVNVIGGTVILELDEEHSNGILTSLLLFAFEEYLDRSVISKGKETRTIRQLSSTQEWTA